MLTMNVSLMTNFNDTVPTKNLALGWSYKNFKLPSTAYRKDLYLPIGRYRPSLVYSLFPFPGHNLCLQYPLLLLDPGSGSLSLCLSLPPLGLELLPLLRPPVRGEGGGLSNYRLPTM